MTEVGETMSFDTMPSAVAKMMKKKAMLKAFCLDSQLANKEPELALASPELSSPARWSGSKVFRSLPAPNFSVLMGDPQLPCVGKLNDQWNPEDIVTRDKLKDALCKIGYTEKEIRFEGGHDSLVQRLLMSTPSFVFNLCDEGFKNDAMKELHIPALLEMLGIPYTGAGPSCLAICYDKGLVNRTAETLGVPTPKETYYFADYIASDASDLDRLRKVVTTDIRFPVFVKPVKGDNSLGITTRSVAHTESELRNYIEELHGIGLRDLIIQEYLQGTEYGVGMVGNEGTGFHFFPILEVDYEKILAQNLPPILGHESKWDPTSPYWTDIKYKRATLSQHVEERLKNHCVALWKRFGCRDYARFDFRCDRGRGDGLSGNAELEGTIKLLEVNPNPGWCWDGKLAYMASFDGFDYNDLIRMILEAAWARISSTTNA